MRRKVSVIIPVYNAEKTIERCLLSVLGQTFDALEIIVVDDASSDNSISATRNICRADNRVRIVKRNKRMGPGDARNSGLSEATGDYIMFIDADDAYEPDAVESAVRGLESYDADLAVFNFQQVQENSMIAGRELVDGVIDVAEYGLNRFLAAYYKLMAGSVWNKIFRADVIRRNGIYFVNNKIVKNEDLLFSLHYTFCIRRIGFVSRRLYRYYPNMGSVSQEKYSQTKPFLLFYRSCTELSRIIHSRGLRLEELESYIFIKTFLLGRRSISLEGRDVTEACLRLISRDKSFPLYMRMLETGRQEFLISDKLFLKASLKDLSQAAALAVNGDLRPLAVWLDAVLDQLNTYDSFRAERPLAAGTH